VARSLTRWQGNFLRTKPGLVRGCINILECMRVVAYMFANTNQVALWAGRREATWIPPLKRLRSNSKQVLRRIPNTRRRRQDLDITSLWLKEENEFRDLLLREILGVWCVESISSQW
jgi:hypothetical protein